MRLGTITEELDERLCAWQFDVQCIVEVQRRNAICRAMEGFALFRHAHNDRENYWILLPPTRNVLPPCATASRPPYITAMIPKSVLIHTGNVQAKL
ncbi:unnamed protein product [Protopolystoma xenopodis]|uniref:Uncharacterized protein n=1 Tax=Protopolystoma xenopodis TaxID=117903 RepID=A0A448X7U3_9PLAT|nr:unnamed protein product [Protopolystoma xenopodis]